MNLHPLLPRVSEEVMRAGMNYARDVCGIEPDENLLRLLYIKTGARKQLLEHTRKGEKKNFFPEARKWALDAVIPVRNAEDQKLYSGYSRAIAKMASTVRQLRRKQGGKEHTKPSGHNPILQYVALGADERQYEFILPTKC
jgi:hypothetical protein